MTSEPLPIPPSDVTSFIKSHAERKQIRQCAVDRLSDPWSAVFQDVVNLCATCDYIESERDSALQRAAAAEREVERLKDEIDSLGDVLLGEIDCHNETKSDLRVAVEALRKEHHFWEDSRDFRECLGISDEFFAKHIAPETTP